MCFNVFLSVVCTSVFVSVFCFMRSCDTAVLIYVLKNHCPVCSVYSTSTVCVSAIFILLFLHIVLISREKKICMDC